MRGTGLGARAKDNLSESSATRSFGAPPEPPAAPAKGRAGPLLFVVQLHAAQRLHFDLRLELDGVLKSWAVPKGPSLDRSQKRFAAQTEDHPYEYASFEGVIPPKQYGAGEVIVWDCGVYTPDEGGEHWFHDRAGAERRVREELEKGKLSVLLRGEKLKGSFALVRMADKKNWLLIKHKDRFAMETDVTAQNRSVLSGMAVADLKAMPVQRIPAARLTRAGEAEAMPAKLAPMLAELREAPFNHADWMWEPKLDGYRVLAFIDGKEVKLRSRRGLDLTASFPQLVSELGQQMVKGMVLDGEIVAFDETGRPSFNELQNRVQLKTEREIALADRKAPVALYCFDLLHFAGVGVRAATYLERRRWLAQCVLPTPHVQLVHAEEDGEALYKAALASGFEGVVAKRKDASYDAGRRSAAWVKVKSTQIGEFVVGGVTAGKGSREPLGALLLGIWRGAKLHYCGHVGSGFDERTLAQVGKRLDALKISDSPFAEKPDLHSPTSWVKPELVAEVKFQEWTADGMLRAPVFLRLREDVDPKSVRRTEPKREVAAASRPANTPVDQVLQQLDNKRAAFPIAVGPHQLRLTNLDRVYWPADIALKQSAVTKRDLLRYLARVSPLMLPHLASRPLTMIRMPSGIGGERFYQKHWD